MRRIVWLFLVVLGVALAGGCTQPDSAGSADSPVDTTWTEPPHDFSFAVLGDSRGSDNGVNSAILGEIVERVLQDGPDFVLFLGDAVTGSSDKSTFRSQLLHWRDVMQPLYDDGIPVYAVRGNHEDSDPGIWREVFSGPYAPPGNGPAGEEGLTYSFAFENALVVGLDVYANPHHVNQTWFDAVLDANTLPHVFVFTHEPAFSVYHQDCLDDDVNARNRFWQSLEHAGARLYLTGHDHFFDESRIDDGDGNPDNDLHQMIVGSAGAPIYSESVPSGDNGPYKVVQVGHSSTYGYMLVDVAGSKVTTVWMARTGKGIYEPVSPFSYTVN
ncbi:MAG: metallophosphoesterase [Deltaproteobacteria bacterium]|nr:metallophosphoesterase [Deltaproteobacteria bacterium]